MKDSFLAARYDPQKDAFITRPVPTVPKRTYTIAAGCLPNKMIILEISAPSQWKNILVTHKASNNS